MTPASQQQAGQQIMAVLHWVLTPSHIIVIAAVIGTAAIAVMILDEWLRDSAKRRRRDHIRRGARARNERALRRALKRRRWW